MPADADFAFASPGGTEPRYAGFWIRFGAHLIDSLLLLLLSFALGIVLFATGTTPADPGSVEQPGSMLDLVSWLVIAAIVVLFWRFRGATPGKMLLGIRIVDAETQGSLGTAQSIGRYLAYILSLVPLFLGFIWIGIDQRKQGFHDKLAGTLVVREADLAGELSRMG